MRSLINSEPAPKSPERHTKPGPLSLAMVAGLVLSPAACLSSWPIPTLR